MAANRLLALLTLALTATAFSGCLSDSTANVPDPSDPADASSPRGDQAGTPGSHGTPRRAEGSVEVTREGQWYVASRTIAVTNDFGGASSSSLTLESTNGALAVRTSDDGGYALRADLWGRGETEEEAREALAALVLESTDSLAGGRLTLSFRVTTEPLPGGLPIPPIVSPLPGATQHNHGGSLTLLVPPQPSQDVAARTTNGGIDVAGLHGPTLDAESTNGGIAVTGAFGSSDLDTVNGGIHLAGTFHDLQATTTNGGVDAILTPTRSGRFVASAENGGVDVMVPAEGAAYDVTGDTVNGDVEIRLGGRVIEDDNHATYRSPGFATAAVQVTLELKAGNGGVEVWDDDY